METLFAVLLGVGLAASAGFRVFVPLLVASLGLYSGHVEVAEGFAWLGSPAALVMLTVATALEIGAYHVPWLDQTLDLVGKPAAVVAGVLLTAAFVTDVSPLMQWSTAIIAGGGAAGVTALASGAVRAVSTATTAGFGNPLVSFGETVTSLVVAIVSMIAPLVAVGLTLVALALAVRTLRRWRAPT